MKKLFFLLASAAALTACSSEPSDWRPGTKVSLDQIAPGTRPTDNFDQGTDAAPNQAKGAAITKPISSAAEDRKPSPTATSVMSADTQPGGKGLQRGEGEPAKANRPQPASSPDPAAVQGPTGAPRQ